MKPIILASSSSRRKELLEQICIPFIVETSTFEEDLTLDLQPEELVRFFSQEKAKEVASRNEQAIIIGADTIVVLQNTILGKPKDLEEAKRMLQSLSNTYHDVLTGITIIDTATKKEISSVVKTRVSFREISSAEIDFYINRYKPLDKAGAYGIQEYAASFVERIEGDYFNIVGLPLYKVTENLKSLGVNLLEYVQKN